MKQNPRWLILWLLFGLSTASCTAAQSAWPCFGGPRRDRKSDDTGLKSTWPDAGPALLWKTDGIGHGYSSVVVTGKRLFTAGMIDRETYVVALDLNDGTILWKQNAGQSWQASEKQRWAVPYAGSRATPTIDGNTLFFLSELGRLSALRTEDGHVRWQVDVAAAFDADKPKYGYAESVLVHGNRLFCCPGGNKGYIVAFDKTSGSTLWVNHAIRDDVGYASPVMAVIEGVRQLVTLSAEHIVAVTPEDGRLLWQFPFGNKRGNNATAVIVHNGLVYASTGYGRGSVLIRPQRNTNGTFTVRQLWTSALLDSHHGGVILHNGHLYGAGHETRGWFCLDLLTGKQRWQSPGKGSLTFADEYLYCLDEKGKLGLVAATPEAYTEVASFPVPKGGKGAYWAHPVVFGKRLYVRHSNRLYAYAVGND